MILPFLNFVLQETKYFETLCHAWSSIGKGIWFPSYQSRSIRIWISLYLQIPLLVIISKMSKLQFFQSLFFKSPNSTCDKGCKCWQQFKSMGNKQFLSYFQQFQFLALYLFVHKKCGSIKLHKLGQESTNILHFEISCKNIFLNEKNSTISNILLFFFLHFLT